MIKLFYIIFYFDGAQGHRWLLVSDKRDTHCVCFSLS